MSDFKFSCPHCDQHIACDETLSGASIRCPACQRDLVVPQLSGATRGGLPPPTPPRATQSSLPDRAGPSLPRSKKPALAIVLAGTLLILMVVGLLFLNSGPKPSTSVEGRAPVPTAAVPSPPEDESIRPLIERIRGKERKDCVDVFLKLLKIGKPAVPGLMKLLDDSNPLTRANAVSALGDIGGEAGLRELAPTIAKLIKDGDAEVRSVAIGALGRIHADAKMAVPILTKSLKDPDIRVRKSATGVLGYYYGSEAKVAVPDIVKLLKAQDAQARRIAVSALKNIGPAAKEAVPALQAALQDSDPDVRDRAAMALNRINSAKPNETR